MVRLTCIHVATAYYKDIFVDSSKMCYSQPGCTGESANATTAAADCCYDGRNQTSYFDGNSCYFLQCLGKKINPRRACAARVTVVVLRESWGAFFSMKGGKGGERGGKGKRVKVQIEEGNSNS